MTTLETLAQAIRSDDVSEARSLLEWKPELAARLNEPLPGESFGGLAIGAATRNRSPHMIELLVSHGADINARSDWWAGGFGVLELCDPALASVLIAHGATVDTCAAARLGDIDQLRALITEDPARVHSRAGDGKTPLHYASSVEIAQLLLDRGADIDAIDVDHESTAAQYLVSEHPDVARFLITRGCRTDILRASALGDVDLVRRILDETPDAIQTRVSDHWFPKQNPRAGGTIYYWTLGSTKDALIVAREKGHRDVEELLAERASPTQLFADLSLLGDVDAARDLAATHADIVKQLAPGELGLLASAVFDAKGDAVRMMLASGWPVNVSNAMGMTPLHAAAWHGHAGLVRELIAAGAAVNVKEREYNGTPLDWAQHGANNSWLRTRGDYASVKEQLVAAGGTGGG